MRELGRALRSMEGTSGGHFRQPDRGTITLRNGSSPSRAAVAYVSSEPGSKLWFIASICVHRFLDRHELVCAIESECKVSQARSLNACVMSLSHLA